MRVPAALLVVLVGVAVAAVRHPQVLRDLRLGPTVPSITLPTWQEWKTGGLAPSAPVWHGWLRLAQALFSPWRSRSIAAVVCGLLWPDKQAG